MSGLTALQRMKGDRFMCLFCAAILSAMLGYRYFSGQAVFNATAIVSGTLLLVMVIQRGILWRLYYMDSHD